MMKTTNPAVGAVGVPLDMAGEPVELPEAADRVTALKKASTPLPGDAPESAAVLSDEDRPQRSRPDA